MSAATHLAQYNLTVADARAFIMDNMYRPAYIYDVAVQYGVDSEMLAEIYGGVTSHEVMQFFFQQGLDAGQLLPTAPATSVVMRGTSIGYLSSQSAVEVQLPQALDVGDLQNLGNYASSLGMFGPDAQVVTMGQAGDPAGYASSVRIATGSGATLTPGATKLTITATDSGGQMRKVTIDLPQVNLAGTSGNDTLRGTSSDELISLTLGGSDTVVLPLPDRSTDMVYDFSPGQGAGADVLDLRAFGLSGIAGTLPVSQVQSVAAFSSSATGAADVSNKVVLVKNVDATLYRGFVADALFGANNPLSLAPNGKALVLVFESNDNFDDIYYVSNDGNAAVTSAEVYDLGAIKLTGTYVPGSGTYVDGSFLTSNFVL